MTSDENSDALYLELDDLTDDEWGEVSELAVRLLEAGRHERNVARCCLEAYVMTMNLRMAAGPRDTSH